MRKLFGGQKQHAGSKGSGNAQDDTTIANSFAGMQLAQPGPPDPYASRETLHRGSQQQQQQQYRSDADRHRNVSHRESSDDNWEILQSSDFRQEGPPSAMLQKPQAPALASRTSSLNILPPGASPPTSAPLVPPAGSPYSSMPVDSSGFSTGSHQQPTSVFNVLRKKVPSNKDQGTGAVPPHKATAAILRALDPLSPGRPDREAARDIQSSLGSEVSDGLSFSDVERGRDSVDYERQRRWEDRDKDIHTPRKRVLDETSSDISRAGLGKQERLHPDSRDTRRRKNSSPSRSVSAERGRGRENVKDKEKEPKEDKKPQWTSLFSLSKDKDRSKGKEHENDSAEEQLNRMIGESLPFSRSELSTLTTRLGWLMVQTDVEWPLTLEVCERASANETNSKQAARSLRKELKCVAIYQVRSLI